jgi:hypothetical protein
MFVFTNKLSTMLQKLHCGIVGGHFSLNIVWKIFNTDYWWHTMNKNVHEYC